MYINVTSPALSGGEIVISACCASPVCSNVRFPLFVVRFTLLSWIQDHIRHKSRGTFHHRCYSASVLAAPTGLHGPAHPPQGLLLTPAYILETSFQFLLQLSVPSPAMLRHAGLQKCIGLSQALALIDPDPDQQIDFPAWLWPCSALQTWLVITGLCQTLAHSPVVPSPEPDIWSGFLAWP